MGFRYIICDDAPFVRELIKEKLFQFGGICIAESDQVQETVILAEQLRPDYLIIDLVLPRQNGSEIFHLLAYDLLKIKIVICSSLDRDLVLSKYPHLSKFDYISKPFRTDDFENIFSRISFKGASNE